MYSGEHTIRAICDLWRVAEARLKETLDKRHVNEEYITIEMCGEFDETLKANVEEIREAINIDLGLHGYQLENPYLPLLAQSQLYSKKREGHIGADFGILLSLPDPLQNITLKRAILCQAKIQGKNGKWGKFTPRQKKRLPSRLRYLGIIGYSFEDVSARKRLNSITCID